MSLGLPLGPTCLSAPDPTRHLLTPGPATQNQWQRKKQTKEQARAAKRGKLDPDSALNRNAKEVLDERARNKRKAEDMDQSEEDSNQEDGDDASDDLEVVGREKPGEGLKKRKLGNDESEKKAKVAEQPDVNAEATAAKLSAHQEKRLLKKQKKSEKKAEKKKSKTEKPAAKGKTVEQDDDEASDDDGEESRINADIVQSKETEDDEEESHQSKDLQPIDVSGLGDDEDEANHSSQSSTPGSPTFDTAEPTDKASAEPASTTTSIASEVAPSERSKKIKVPSDTTELRARLAAKIAALRAARKADGPDGTPIRTRQELIESRRKKQAERKAHKKELRQKEKEAEDKKREEALASARNSPMLSFGSPEHEGDLNFSFGRVAFADGTQMSQDLSYVKDKSGKKKGPMDPKGALAKLEAQKRRLAALDADKRKEVLEKETWLAARRRAEGEKVRNDESLLKKAVKRKEKTKKKSEREWTERTRGVEHAQKQRQQKREDNIRKRKETKSAGKAGKKKGGSGGKSPAKKKAGRPGFEGSGFGGGKRR